MRRYGVVVMFMLAAFLRPDATAEAAAPYEGSTRGDDAVLYDGCRMWGIGYQFELPANSFTWTLDLVVYGPDGIETSSDYVTGVGSLANGRAEHQVCGNLQDPGRYSIQSFGEWCDNSYNCTRFNLPTSNFNIRAAKTTTKLKVSDSTPNFNQRVRFSVVSKDERPEGFFPSDFASVQLQVKGAGGWTNVKGGQIFTSDGRGSVSYIWDVRATLKFRALRKPEDNYGKSISKTVTVR